jgi:hypothetical protein
MMITTRLLRALPFVFATGIASVSNAQISNLEVPGNFEVHGFATQNFLLSTDNKLFGDSESGSFEFFEVGINGNWQASDRLTFSAQVTARDAGQTDDGKPRLDYAFLDYRFYDTDTYDAGFRLGRAVNSLGLYNSTRDVAKTRPSILLPQSIYFDTLRNLALSSDGIYFYQDFFNGAHEFSTEFSYTEPRTEDPDLEPVVLSSFRPGRFDGASSWLAHFLYDYDFGRLRLGLTTTRVSIDYISRDDPFLSDGQFIFSPIILSAQYQSERITYSAEYSRRKSEIKGLGIIDGRLVGTGFYLQTQYRLNNQWSFYARYDSLVNDNKDRFGEVFEQNTGVSGNTRYAKDFILGARWDINQNWLISAEYHDIEGRGWLSLLENPPVGGSTYWDLFLMSVSARF